MSLLMILLVLILLGAVLPVFPHSASWGYGPSSLLGVILVVLVVLMVTGRL